ncbi:hypothetical protein SMICM304S_11382 [Streptomyces microflavus]
MMKVPSDTPGFGSQAHGAYAAALSQRHALSNSSDDLDASIRHLTAAFRQTAVDDVNRVVYLQNLAIALYRRYQTGGDLQDLTTATRYMREVTAVLDGVDPRVTADLHLVVRNRVLLEQALAGLQFMLAFTGGSKAGMLAAVATMRRLQESCDEDAPELLPLEADLGLMLLVVSFFGGTWQERLEGARPDDGVGGRAARGPPRTEQAAAEDGRGGVDDRGLAVQQAGGRVGGEDAAGGHRHGGAGQPGGAQGGGAVRERLLRPLPPRARPRRRGPGGRGGPYRPRTSRRPGALPCRHPPHQRTGGRPAGPRGPGDRENARRTGVAGLREAATVVLLQVAAEPALQMARSAADRALQIARWAWRTAIRRVPWRPWSWGAARCWTRRRPRPTCLPCCARRAGRISPRSTARGRRSRRRTVRGDGLAVWRGAGAAART